VRDISALAAVPGLVMAEPSAEAEVQPLLDALANGAGSGYLRLVSVKWPLPFAYPAGHRAEVGKGWTAREGADGVIFAYGPWLVSNACQAADDVEAATGARLAVTVLPWLNRVDSGWLRGAVGSRRVVITLDNHYLQGGQGEMIAAAIARLSLQPSPSVTSLGVTVAARVRHQRRGAAASRPRRGEPGAAVPRRPRAGTCTMTVLFWDIDGTLLTTAKGGMFAWDDGVKEITGKDFQLQTLRVPGMTDYQIAAKTCELLGLDPSEPLVERLVRRYEALLPTSLPRRVGHVLPNVREILEQLRGRSDVRSYLLTGNTRGGARRS
jgi:hypothetical protein